MTANDGIYSGTFPEYLRNVTVTERFSLLVIRKFRFLAWKTHVKSIYSFGVKS